MARIKLSTFFKNCALLLRCIFALASFAALWVGIAIYNTNYGVWLIIIGALATALSLFTNIVLPVSKLKNKRR
ncbi:MAG: hypothetical protein IKZ03_02605 [Clostridia bacterium]|nr:hypothetical protein [Clostridia bacterium]